MILAGNSGYTIAHKGAGPQPPLAHDSSSHQSNTPNSKGPSGVAASARRGLVVSETERPRSALPEQGRFLCIYIMPRKTACAIWKYKIKLQASTMVVMKGSP